MFYENLHFENVKSNQKSGVKIGLVNRPVYLETLQNRLLNQTVRINSARFVTELQTFEYNPVTKKAQAQKNKHDDAIMAMCIALHIRDSMMRDMPMGAEMPKEVSATLKAQVYEEIKRELMEGKPEDFLMDQEMDLLMPDKDSMPMEMYNLERKNHRLLSEFGW